MKVKRGRFGSFLACSRYPDCDYKKDLSTLRAYLQEFRPALIGVDGEYGDDGDDLLHGDAGEDRLYGGNGTIESNTVAVYIHQLRRKLGEEVVVTVHGYGYRLGDAEG